MGGLDKFEDMNGLVGGGLVLGWVILPAGVVLGAGALVL